MPYDLSFQVRPDYVTAKLSVKIAPGQELKEAMERWEAIARICRENNRDKVLVVMSFNGSYGMETKFKLAKGASSIGWTPNLKLAVVIADPDRFSEQLFTETALNNLGYEMKLFLKKRPAKKWLLG